MLLNDHLKLFWHRYIGTSKTSSNYCGYHAKCNVTVIQWNYLKLSVIQPNHVNQSMIKNHKILNVSYDISMVSVPYNVFSFTLNTSGNVQKELNFSIEIKLYYAITTGLLHYFSVLIYYY